MGNNVGDAEQNDRVDREGTSAPQSRMVWHQIVVRHSSVWHPPTDVFRTADRVVVVIEIAGMNEDDFEISLQNRQLTVGGVRQHLTNREEDVAYHQMEIERGAFRTVIDLPWNVDRAQVSATYRDGLLKIAMPRLDATAIHVVNMPQDQNHEA